MGPKPAICQTNHRGVDDRRDAVVGGNAQEVRLELLALADVHRNDAVGDAGLFQKDRDLVAVGRRPIIEIDHGVRSSAGAHA
jgi:hypothetical protein